MARLGHRQPNLTSNRIRKPTVVGPIAILPPIKRTLAVHKTRQQYTVRGFKQQSIVRKPTVVGPIAILPPVKTRLAVGQHRAATAPFRQPKYKLRKPAVLQAVIVPDTGITASSDVSATLQNVVPVAGSITATSAISGQVSTLSSASQPAFIKTQILLGRRQARGRLLPPTVVDQAVAPTPPVDIQLSVTTTAVRGRLEMSRRAAKSKLSAPATLTPPPAIPTPDQLKIRQLKAPQPRRLPARVTFTSPAIVNPITPDYKAQVKPKTTLAAINSRHTYRLRTPKSRYVKPSTTGGLDAIQPAAFAASSAVTGTVRNLVPITPSTLTSSSTITGTVAHLTQIQGSLTATSTIFASVTGGNIVTQTTDHAPFAFIYYQ